MSLIDSIKKNEGYRPMVYDDHLGNPTIGYGFLISQLHLDEDICDMILERKVGEIKLQLHRKFPFVLDLPEEVQDVCIEMVFQLGLKSFSRFRKTIALLRLGNFKAAADEMLDSKWAREQTPARAKRLSNIVKYAK